MYSNFWFSLHFYGICHFMKMIMLKSYKAQVSIIKLCLVHWEKIGEIKMTGQNKV